MSGRDNTMGPEAMQLPASAFLSSISKNPSATLFPILTDEKLPPLPSTPPRLYFFQLLPPDDAVHSVVCHLPCQVI